MPRQETLVFDAAPLIALSAAGFLPHVTRLGARIVIADEVRDEGAAEGRGQRTRDTRTPSVDTGAPRGRDRGSPCAEPEACGPNPRESPSLHRRRDVAWSGRGGRRPTRGRRPGPPRRRPGAGRVTRRFPVHFGPGGRTYAGHRCRGRADRGTDDPVWLVLLSRTPERVLGPCPRETLNRMLENHLPRKSWVHLAGGPGIGPLSWLRTSGPFSAPATVAARPSGTRRRA